MALRHAGDGRQDLARRAIAALEGIVIHEGLLHWMERSVRTRQPFNGADLMPLGRDGERKT